MSEANNQSQQTEEIDYLSMSDDEIRNMTGPGPTATTSTIEEEEEKDDKEEQAADEAGAQDNQADPDSKDSDEEDKEEDRAENADGEGADQATEQKSESEGEGQEAKQDGDGETEAKDVETKPAEKAKADESTIDYKAEYERLLAPFKANGRDIKVNNIDEAVTLMQMGANYNKKMAALKPNLKLMKMLEKSGLMSEEKISFLIDLDKKNPAAINKLVKDSGIDPMDLDADKASAYKQTAYTVDDREIELDTVLEELQGTPSYNRTLEIVGTKWDAASKHVIADNPGIIKVINGHIASGIYDKIQKVIDNERMFGRLVGLSDIEAYRQVGDALHARGEFNAQAQGSSQAQAKPAAEKVVVQPKPKQDDDGKLKDKKRAASSTKQAVSDAGAADFNPLAMSDEEFAKHVNKQFL